MFLIYHNFKEKIEPIFETTNGSIPFFFFFTITNVKYIEIFFTMMARIYKSCQKYIHRNLGVLNIP